ncbi:secreted carbohydrate-binding protein, putative [Psychroflexus torquis ATCC 700755]|uniref:Secreted carbohydrate-binding protein, putative n=1 Tax=Psychroflexus torquis (strain ATCC 700755 / CIP 106069 / ACAM 623) TaxID=313595 RepID=K4IJ77_PSYTT|nr:carbohydrate-binding protein [Psychroflexus torquis]AFU69878.1 secreted carbohydrate-binding protein, putative [Psychroflexus torquis ATCC 700755]
MIHNKLKYLQLIGLVLLSMVVTTSCEREVSDDAILATFPTTADVFTDNPVGLTDEFFISFDPVEGANTEAFGTDNNEAYLGSSSIRIDVPSPDDPNGNFVGGIFRDRGEGRNLTGYDALTFWAKGSATGILSQVGFGTDFLEDKYPASRTAIQLTTDWKKYTIPIPNSSKLTQERGMFLFAAGGLDIVDDEPNGNEIGWTFWLDEIKFEKLGTLLLTEALLFNGQDLSTTSFQDSRLNLFGISTTFNLETGENVQVATSPLYFDFQNSDPNVAEIDFTGEPVINIIGDSGTTLISATISNANVQGSYEITSLGPLPFAPIPSLLPENVKSVFSDSYQDVVQINFDPGFGGSTTQVSLFERLNNTVSEPFNDQTLVYSTNNFTGILFDGIVDASNLSFMHVDIFIEDENGSIEFQIRDAGEDRIIDSNNNGFPINDDRDFRRTISNLNPGEWNSIEIPLAGNISNQKDNLAGIILVGGPDFILDNIYFYVP